MLLPAGTGWMAPRIDVVHGPQSTVACSTEDRGLKTED